MMETEFFYYGAIIFLFLLMSAFFSASETALTAITRARLYHLIKEKVPRAATVGRLRKEKEALIGSILIGNNLVNIAASALATSIAIRLFGDGEGLLVVTLVMTLLVVIFAEILPKTYAILHAERVSLAVAPLLAVIVTVLNPISRLLQKLIRCILKLFGVDITKPSALLSASDIIRGAIELHHREGQMVKQDRDMLGSILDLDEIEVSDVMVHRKQLDMVDCEQPVQQLINEIYEMQHSRIPVWQGNHDNIIGVLHMKDLVRTHAARGEAITMEEVLASAQEPWFIPETTPLRDQLLAFRSRRQHFALVVDEYGTLQGVVTLEDIIEEIVGEIDDEHDDIPAGDIQHTGTPNTYYVAGDVTIRDLNRELDWNLPDNNASTIAGLLMHEVQDIPSKGQFVELFGYRVLVVDKNRAQIKRLKIEKLATSEEPHEPM